MDERVKVGMLVRDADGKRLGRVSRLDEGAFEVVRRFWSPYEWAIRWDEVLDAKDGVVSVARSDDDLLELARGGLPHAWRRVRPPEAQEPIPATPSESAAGAAERVEVEPTSAPQS
jgi:hypothetical protein